MYPRSSESSLPQPGGRSTTPIEGNRAPVGMQRRCMLAIQGDGSDVELHGQWGQGVGQTAHMSIFAHWQVSGDRNAKLV